MLKAIWPSIATIPNRLSPSSRITSLQMLCYFLYWSFQFPFMFVSPQRIRWLFVAKGIIVPTAWVAMLIWAFVKVPSHGSLLSQHANVSGSALSWAWLHAYNSAIANYSTLAVNITDFTVSTFIRPCMGNASSNSFISEEIRKECQSVRPPSYRVKKIYSSWRTLPGKTFNSS